MDQEVARTLAELELKLRELERELTSIGRRQNVAATQPSGLQQPSSTQQDAGLDRGVAATAGLDRGTEVSSPAVIDRSMGGGQPGVLVDEVVERRYSMDAQQTVYGEIPATRDARQSIDLAELVRFKDMLERTLQMLIDEYSRLLSLRPPAGS